MHGRVKKVDKGISEFRAGQILELAGKFRFISVLLILF